MKRQVAGRRFSILGGARSGLAAAGLLRAAGAEVFVSEKAAAALGSLPDELERMGVPAEFGGHTARASEADVLVLSPGVPSTVPLVKAAVARGTEVVSELEVASWFCPGPIVAITGTNGKTTTTVLIGRIFEDAKVRSVVAGNIGTAFSQVVTGMPMPGCGDPGGEQLSARPHHGVPAESVGHPEHHPGPSGPVREHVRAVRRIEAEVFENQGMGDTLIYNADDPATARWSRRRRPRG